MVFQRLDRGHGPGPINVFKTVRREELVGTSTKSVSVRVPLDHCLQAGTDALTPADKQVLAVQGLSDQQIAYVESKLPAMMAKSNAHKSAFEAGEANRKRQGLKTRVVAQMLSDSELLADVMSAIGMPDPRVVAPTGLVKAKPPMTLSERIPRLVELMAEVSADIARFKNEAKVAKVFDQQKLRAMFSGKAAQEWTLCWFAFSQMIDRAKGTPFARPKAWHSNPEFSKLADARGFKPAKAAADGRDDDA